MCFLLGSKCIFFLLKGIKKALVRLVNVAPAQEMLRQKAHDLEYKIVRVYLKKRKTKLKINYALCSYILR